MSYLSTLYHSSLSLLTDLYQLTMCYGYWKLGLKEKQACFYLFFRRKPFGGSYAVAAGLESVIDFIQNFQFKADDLEYLSSLTDSTQQPLFSQDFIQFLKNYRLTCDVDAVEEGSLVFPYEPILRVKGPLIDCQILESPILNLMNFPTLIATKSSRIVRAAGADEVIEFGVRRAQGVDGAITATRASYIGGCQSTSHVLGGKLFNIPVRGTHSHSWVLAHDTEKLSFHNIAQILPNNCTFLVDTYNTIEGTKNAAEVAKDLGKNFSLFAVRLDSGDLATLSIQVRQILDKQGLNHVKIMASNELDEDIIRDLKYQGAQVDLWGVGTKLVTGSSQAALDGVYKLSAIQDHNGQWIHRLKISESIFKVTDPGLLKVRRYISDQGFYIGDMIYDEVLGVDPQSIIIDSLEPSNTRSQHKHFIELLKPIFREGQLKYDSPSLQDMQKKTKEEFKKLNSYHLRFLNPHPYFVGLEQKVYNKKIELITS